MYASFLNTAVTLATLFPIPAASLCWSFTTNKKFPCEYISLNDISRRGLFYLADVLENLIHVIISVPNIIVIKAVLFEVILLDDGSDERFVTVCAADKVDI